MEEMKMKDVIARINALAHKAKVESLTPEELAERDKLRRIYIDSVKANLTGQLDNTYLLRPDGHAVFLNAGGRRCTGLYVQDGEVYWTENGEAHRVSLPA